MEQPQITITQAGKLNRLLIVELLNTLKLPTDDLTDDISHFYVAQDASHLAGVIGYEVYGQYCLLRSLAVDLAYRNQGIAEKLVSRLEEIVRELGIEQMYLLTETAEAYFAKKGYIKTDRESVPDAVKQSTEFSHVCPQSAVVMFKRII